ncbi:MAG TPA: VWA domain-containing protein [Gemmataceae bacterium]|nr:VWA domain-containing protein [Gemmataceae bacterium]
MNEPNNTSTYQELVWRRLSEPLTVRGHDFPSWLWLLILGAVLAAGFAYIVWMYVKDSRGVGPWWAIFLGTLRACVYAILAVVFLLPAKQTWEETRVMGKVLVLVDASPSMTKVMDDIPSGKSDDKLLTRQDKVHAFLTKADNKFFTELEAKNPVSLFRFASRLDENFMLFKDGRNWTREEWEKFTRDAERNAEPPEAKPLPAEYLQAWLNPGTKIEPPPEWSDEKRERLHKLDEMTKKLGEADFFTGTNLGSAALSLVNRELNGRVQGIVIITDGRSTEGSPRMFAEIETRAKSARIPIFVVGVGQERPQIKIDIVDLRVPEQVQPEDAFRAVVELQGEGLPDKPVKVFLDITHTVKDKSGKDVDLDLALTEQIDKNNPDEKRTKLPLGTKKLTLEAPLPVKFDRSSPPRVTVEFPIDAAAVAKAAHIDLGSGDAAGKKWELSETGEGELRFRVRVPRDAQEAFASPFHITEPAILRVVKRPLRVLLFASSATRDYQFLRSILVREMDKKRAELSIYLQLPPGVTERRGGIVQDVPPERLLGQFPTRLESADKDEQLYALDQYDVIVAFDPDWTQLSESQLKMVGRWVENGGGLIAVGGAINTLELARPKSHAAKLKPILDLYPVVLSDIRISDFDRETRDAWPLDFPGATPDMEFLKLDESEDAKFLADWDAFFYGPEGKKGSPVVRGFYNYYPVEKAKTSAVVVARFADPKGKLKDNSLQPYLVTTSPSSNRRVVWLGSGEMWRLRSFNVSYHERFWMKLLRYSASNTMSRISKRIRLYMGSTHIANKPIEFEGKFDGKDGEPLAPGPKMPTVQVAPPPGLTDSVVPRPFEMKAKPNGEGWFSGRFQVRAAGEYTLTVKNPETGDALTHRFSVKEANPEMDNTRPDFQTMYELAGEADDVLGRIGDAERQELKRRLQRPKMESDSQADNKDDKLRLYFDLKNAHLIPACMRPDVQTLRNRGPIQDLWDDSFVVWDREPQPVTMPYVLLAVVGLLSLEWLTRKLLRLA